MVSSLLLVIVHQVDVVGVAILKSEGDPPVAGNRNAPRPTQVAPQGMQSLPRQINIARLAGGIEVCQGESDPVQQVCVYPAGVVPLMEPP